MSIRKFIKRLNWGDITMVILGNFLLGFSFGALLNPKDIVAGGSSGIALILSDQLGWSPSLVISLILWGFFALGLILFGRKFAAKTLLATLFLPIGVWVPENWAWLLTQVDAIQESWIVAVISALMGGVGMGMTFKAGGSTGGFDVVGYIFQKYFRIRLTVTLFVIDAIIMLVGLLVFPLESILIGVTVSLFTTLVIDQILFGGSDLIQAQIISKEHEAILTYVHDTLQRGSTIYEVTGGHSGNLQKLILVILSKRQFNQLRHFIKNVDQRAFISLVKTHAVIGEGFTDWGD